MQLLDCIIRVQRRGGEDVVMHVVVPARCKDSNGRRGVGENTTAEMVPLGGSGKWKSVIAGAAADGGEEREEEGCDMVE